MLIEEGHDLPHQLLGRLRAGRLGGRDQVDACLLQALGSHLHADEVAVEAAIGMNDNGVEGALRAAGQVQHAGEFGARGVGAGSSGVDENSRHFPTPALAIHLDLMLLAGQGDIALRLPDRADAKIGGDPHRLRGGQLRLDGASKVRHVHRPYSPCLVPGSVAQLDEKSNIWLAASTEKLAEPVPAKEQFQRGKLCI